MSSPDTRRKRKPHARHSDRVSSTSSSVHLYGPPQYARVKRETLRKHDAQDYEMHDESDHTNSPVLFYDRNKPFYEFTNFSYHPVEFDGKVYPTAEHLFQASKFIEHYPHIAEEIRHLPTPREALQTATSLQHLRRRDWFDMNVNIMDIILEAKFSQHGQLYNLLLDTGDRELIEASPIDSFWGWGENRQGRNELGKALMRLRDKLRKVPQTSGEHVQSGSSW